MNGFGKLPARAGVDARSLADPSGGALAQSVAARLHEAFVSGHHGPVFAGLRENADLARVLGAAPALDALIDSVCRSVRPWAGEGGDPLLRELAHLLAIEPFESAHVVEDENGGLHLLESGELLARTLQNMSAFSYCGLPVASFVRAPRGAWSTRGLAQCRACAAGEDIIDARDRRPHPLPLGEPQLRNLERRFALRLAAKVRARPQSASERWERWVSAAYVPELRLALGATARSCINGADGSEGRFRWALGGRYAAADPSRRRLIDNQLDMLIEYTRTRDWQSACPTPAQLADGTAAKHLADRLCRRLFSSRRQAS